MCLHQIWLYKQAKNVMPNIQDAHQHAKMMKMQNEWKHLSSETEKSFSTKLLTCWKFPPGQLKAFWKTTQMCVPLLPNLCPATTHLAKSVYKLWAKNKMNVIPHPPYSLDLVPRDIFLFQELKMELMQMRF